MKKFLPAVGLVVLLASCASIGDPFMLTFSVPDTEKSAALSRTGIEIYKTEIVAEGKLEAIDRARKFFEAALRYSPSNAEAERYLGLVEDYRAGKFSASLSKAQELLKKKTRNAEDEYQLYASLRRAGSLDPKDEEVKKLLSETAEARAAFVKGYLDKSTALKQTIKPESTEAAKEKVYIEAFGLLTRAVEVEPNDFTVSQAYRELRTEVSAIIERRIEAFDALLAKNSFTEARSQIALLRELDAKIGRDFKDELVDVEYRLYFTWATYHEKRKEWSAAETRISQALAIKKTPEGAVLAKRATTARAAEEQGADFESGLKNIDARVAKGDLSGAQRIIIALGKSATDAARKKSLDARRAAVRDALGGIYARGVKAYQEERFKDAIAALQTVIEVDASYEEASDYLEKAQSKQKLLEQY